MSDDRKERPFLPPRWFVRLVAQPAATPRSVVDLSDGRRDVTGRAAEGEERSRLWARWRTVDEKLGTYAVVRSRETAVVLEPT